MSSPVLDRRLRLMDSVVVGLAAMIGAGVFVVFAPAAQLAGPLLGLALLLAAVVAWCNAASSARLARRHPRSGGTYVYGTEQLGPAWGHLAGWGFVVGKTASCAAMAWTLGAYAWPGQERLVGVAATAAVTALNLFGIQRSARVARIIVTVVLVVLLTVVVVAWAGPPATTAPVPGSGPDGLAVLGPDVLGAAGLLFFAFAGYARLATLGEEVRDPVRTIPRAVAIALAVTVLLYGALAWSLTRALGGALPVSTDPLVDTASAAGADWLVPLVRGAALLAAGGALLTLVLGVSRTALAMARDGHLWRGLAVIDPVRSVPRRLELVVGTAVIALVLLVDLREAIGFSSFCVLIYYLIANLSAWTLAPTVRVRGPAALGAVGCLALALSLPLASVLTGAAVLVTGALFRILRSRLPRFQLGGRPG